MCLYSMLLNTSPGSILLFSIMSSRGLQDMSSRRLQDMSSRRLQDFFSVTIFRLPKRLQHVKLLR